MFPWETIKRAVSEIEKDKIDEELSFSGKDDNDSKGSAFRKKYFEIAGAVIAGVNAAIISVVINFIVYVWVFHLNLELF